MSRVVVIATAALGRGALESVVDPEDELYVVVPAVEQSRLQWLANDEDEARAEAAEVGREIARETSAEVAEIEVKPDSPSQLVRDAIALHEPDRIILAVREGDDATWMEDGELADPAAEIEGVPITRVRL